jgi:hypothetical protein
MSRTRHSSRSLEIAAVLARCLGGLLLCLAAILVPLSFDLDRYNVRVLSIVVAVLTLFLIVPAILYFVFAGPMGRGRRWALVTMMVFAAVHVAGFALFPLLIVANGGGLGQFALLLIGAVLLLASFLIVYCVRALPATRPAYDPQMRRGFEPVMAGSRSAAQSVAFPLPPTSLKPDRPPAPGDR